MGIGAMNHQACPDPPEDHMARASLWVGAQMPLPDAQCRCVLHRELVTDQSL